MSDAKFDISFSGALKPDADPSRTREQLSTLFKLDETGIERLFCGKPIFIKRGVDAATAARYKRVFDEAGAIVEILLGDAPPDARSQSSDGADDDQRPPEAQDPSGLSLAPMDGFLEEPPDVKILELDISHLSLVPGPEWSLSDCEPDPPEIDLPDTSHLTLEAMEARPEDNDTRT